MKFDPKTRVQLLRAGALAIDTDGDEVLIGLTVAESKFVMDLRNAPRSESGRCATAEERLYLELFRRHRIAFYAHLRGMMTVPVR